MHKTYSELRGFLIYNFPAYSSGCMYVSQSASCSGYGRGDGCINGDGFGHGEGSDPEEFKRLLIFEDK